MGGGRVSAGPRPEARARAICVWLTVPVAAVVIVIAAVAPGGAAAPRCPSTVPSVTITAPRPSTFVGGVVQIEVAASEGVDAVTVEASRTGGASWSVVATCLAGDGGFVAVWDTRPWSGEASIRAVTTGATSAPVALHVDNAAPRASVGVSRRYVRSGLEPAQERVHGTIRAGEPSWVQLRVVSAGRPLTRLRVRTTLGRLFTFAWSPRSRGKLLPDGVYRLVARLRDRAGNGAEAVGQVVIDTRPPTLSELTVRVDAHARGLVVRFRSEDRTGIASARARAWHVNGGAELPGTRLVRDSASQWHLLLGTSLLPGAYAIRLTLRDGAGNEVGTAEQRLLVRRAVRTQVIARVLGVGRKVALTFDDCNSGVVWDRILSTLAERRVHAAFFCSAQLARANREQAARALAEGHVVGSHGGYHASLAHLRYKQVRSRLDAESAAWWSMFRASATPYFRPPYGLFTRTTLAAAGDAGFAATVLWDVDPWDWSSPGAGAITSRVVAASRTGSIILLHVMPQTAEALASIITGLRSRGLEPVGLDELLWAPSAVRTAGGWSKRVAAAGA